MVTFEKASLCQPRSVLPVDPPRAFLRLDVDIIVVDINLGNLHLEVVGQETDGLPHRAHARSAGRLEEGGGGRGACNSDRNITYV